MPDDVTLDAGAGSTHDASPAGTAAERFRSVFQDAADAMLILDDTRRVVDANRAASALFGPAAETVGRSLDDLVGDDGGQVAGAWRELLALGEAKREHRLLSAGRGPRLVECSYRTAVPEGGHLCIARDVTERRLLEERLVQSERIDSVGRLAGGIAHDFNNLLTAILGYTELLLASRGPDDPERSNLEEIQKAGQRAAALTQQLLAYSRYQALMPKEVDLNQTVSNILGMLTRLIRADITLICESAPRPALVKIDPTQLEQVILNLVLNARDALPAGGIIRLEVSHARLSEHELPPDYPTRAPEYVRLRVADNGEGIAPEARAHLFEPFFTTKAIGKGTGLGLASVYGIIRQSDGFIGVESELGRGATFTMHFPAVDSVAAAELPPTALESTPEGRETILLVEDEDAVRVAIGAVLRRHRYRVFEAPTPNVACDVFERHGSEIDLLITDVVMPGMNGPALAQRLIASRPGLRVLLISGYAEVASSLDAGSSSVGFLSKPFRASVLGNKVREVLSGCGNDRRKGMSRG